MDRPVVSFCASCAWVIILSLWCMILAWVPPEIDFKTRVWEIIPKSICRAEGNVMGQGKWSIQGTPSGQLSLWAGFILWWRWEAVENMLPPQELRVFIYTSVSHLVEGYLGAWGFNFLPLLVCQTHRQSGLCGEEAASAVVTHGVHFIGSHPVAIHFSGHHLLSHPLWPQLPPSSWPLGYLSRFPPITASYHSHHLHR